MGIEIIQENFLDKEAMKCFDTKLVTNMNNLFASTDVNADISSWDVSSVTYMNAMFFEATTFNSDVSNWDVSSVRDMDSMFYEAKQFNGDVSDWDVSSVKDMDWMFYGATDFNQQMCWLMPVETVEG